MNFFMFDWNHLLFSVSEKLDKNIERPFGVDLSLDAMRDHSYNIGIFIFLIIGILVFLSVAYYFMTTDKKSKIKKGEWFLLAWIFFGVVSAIALGAIQLLDGFLF